MPVLPRVVLAAAVLSLPVLLAGCAKFDASLGQQQAIVSFKPGTTTAERLAIRAACAKSPGVTVPAVPDLKKYPYALEELTYSVTKATTAQISGLSVCLNKFPSVAGVTLQDSSDDS
jgi:hypothetical protein